MFACRTAMLKHARKDVIALLKGQEFSQIIAGVLTRVCGRRAGTVDSI